MVTDPAAPPEDPLSLLRERRYVVTLIFAAIVGAPMAFVAFWFLQAVTATQDWVFSDLPTSLGFHQTPTWWAIPVLGIAGLGVAACIRFLPGTGGHVPAAGLAATGSPTGRELPGVAAAAFLSLALGAVVGPEAPLIAIGGGLAAHGSRTLKKDAPEQSATVIGAAGSFAAISTLFGSPITGAFLLMEVAGLAGPMIGVMLVPGLLAAGIGVAGVHRPRRHHRLRDLLARPAQHPVLPPA